MYNLKLSRACTVHPASAGRPRWVVLRMNRYVRKRRACAQAIADERFLIDLNGTTGFRIVLTTTPPCLETIDPRYTECIKEAFVSGDLSLVSAQSIIGLECEFEFTSEHTPPLEDLLRSLEGFDKLD